MTALAGFVAFHTHTRVVCDYWRGGIDAGARQAWLKWLGGHLDHGCTVSNVLHTDGIPLIGEVWPDPAEAPS